MKTHFIRSYTYKHGIAHGNPDFNSRFRVNAPEASLHPDFMYRDEVRGNGMLQILMEEDLAQLAGAELYCEIWGGHPGTASKRVSVNGRSTYALPEVGTLAEHCTHQYPNLPLQLTDLVNGYNVFQFACDQGSAFWGHFIVDNASLNVALRAGHPDLHAWGLRHFGASVQAKAVANEKLRLSLASTDADRIAHVDFLGYYQGYDENGNTLARDWHGFTKDYTPVGIVASVQASLSFTWDMAMLPDQADIAVRAVVHFKEFPTLRYHTDVTSVPGILARDGSVKLYSAQDIPAPFWSRAGQAQRCVIPLEIRPARIERAQLHVVIWDGGRGTVETPFTLNGQPLPVAGDGHHDVLYRVLEVDPRVLRQGDNEIVVHSDTEHHGIEVLLPGPALMVRCQ